MTLVTVDLFSALLDSRKGATRALEGLSAVFGWNAAVAPQMYEQWDAHNKALHAECLDWVSFRELSAQAMANTLECLRLPGDPVAVSDRLLASVGWWPLWPDVDQGLKALSQVATVGVLSNVDDDIYERTAVADRLGTDHALTSERLQAYKPDPQIYTRARDAAPGSYVHVASSPRDVHGACSAGVPTIRLMRQGFEFDDEGCDLVARVAELRRVPQCIQ